MQRCSRSAGQLRQSVGEEVGNSYDCIRFSPYPVLAPLTAMILHAPSKYLKAALCKYHLVLLSFRDLQHQSVAAGLQAGAGGDTDGAGLAGGDCLVLGLLGRSLQGLAGGSCWGRPRRAASWGRRRTRRRPGVLDPSAGGWVNRGGGVVSRPRTRREAGDRARRR